MFLLPIKKSAFIAFQIFYNQPFPDGNKRVARLAVTYIMMSKGYPLACFKGVGTNFNEALLRSYFSKDFKSLMDNISMEYTQQLLKYISVYKELSKKTKPPKLGDDLSMIF
ncbi:MAG: Fic family protein [Bacteroidia bacterium]|nr:Fic family protein [Bacteroidia bacterium]